MKLNQDATILHRLERSALRLRTKKLPRPLRIALTAVVVAVAAVLGVWAFRYYEDSPWTRDGRISAYVVDSATEIGGLVTEVAVQDNQFVHKGDLLFRIDPRDYRAAADRAAAQLLADEATYAADNSDARIADELFKRHAGSEVDKILKTGRRDAAKAAIDATQAGLYKAQVDLARCEVRSAVNGYVTNLAVRAGNYATTGQRQMSVIDADSYWITGYFEETRLRHIHVGASARAVLMGYPNLPVTGQVESLNRGIADTNTAPNPQGLPQVDPVFTWVRLAQRIPVRIHIDHVPDGVHLAIGETCTVHIEERR